MTAAKNRNGIFLVVEDSRSVARELVRQICAKLNTETIVAETFQNAERLIRDCHDDIEVAILDLNIPDAPDGEVVRLARAYNIPSVVFTSNIDEDVRKKILNMQVIDYVVKDSRAIENIIRLLLRLRKNREIKVLVVDDSHSFREYMRQLLDRYRFEALLAEDAEEAIEIISENPDILLTVVDYAMPGMNGVELVREIRRKPANRDMAIIGVSSEGLEPLSVWFLKAGANDFLRKPFPEEEFYSRVISNVEAVERVRELGELNEVKDRFVSVAAHDLRTPINGIRGFADLMLNTEMSDEQKEMLQIIREASNHMLSLVNDLLDLSVIRSGRLDLRRSTVDLAALVAERVNTHRFAAEDKGIEIRMESVPSLSARVDESRFRQAVDNLLGNAIKFSPRKSTVRVQLVQASGLARIFVADDGPGIPEEEQAGIFEAFSKASVLPSAGEKSTGLGLAIVKSIVESHGGTLSLKSEVGRGSVFTIELPLNLVS